MKNSKHSPETVARMQANSDAAKRRLAQLNREYQIRQKAKQIVKALDPRVNFGEAIARMAEEQQVAI